jgi:putative flippase GtrA
VIDVLRRWIAFNFVGLIGVGLQLLLLWLFTGPFGLPYLSATALAVEITVLHNFIWHERWTWADRKSASVRDTLWRLLRFNSSNGAVSIVGNVVFMRFLVGTFGIPLLVANSVSIVLCSLLNFVLSDRFVFARGHSSFPQRGLCSHGELGRK